MLYAMEFSRKLSCGHFYHESCVDLWLIENDTCPLSRFATVVSCFRKSFFIYSKLASKNFLW